MANKAVKLFLGDTDSNGQYVGYRLAFAPNLAETRVINGEDTGKYDITLLIPKTDKAGIKRIKDAVNNAIDSSDWSAKQKQAMKKQAWDFDAYNDYCIMKDGDEKNARALDEEGTAYEQRDGHYTLKLSRKASFGIPLVADADAQTIPTINVKGAVQPGFWVNVSGSVYCGTYNKTKPYISLQFDAVQLVKEGEVFGQSNPFEAVEMEPTEVESSTEESTVFD